MEHRHSKRLPANVRLRLYKRGQPVATGRLMDVSRHGLFVALDDDEIGVNQVVELEFASTEQPVRVAGNQAEALQAPDAEPTQPRMSAVVVHKTDQGLGLELEEHTHGLPELYNWLRRRLRNEETRNVTKRAQGEPAKPRRAHSQYSQ